METIIIKLFFIGLIVLFLIGMFIPMVLVKKKGKDPHGTHEGSSILTRLGSISIFMWLFYIILYIIIDDLIISIWLINVLMNDFFIILGFILIVFGFVFEILGIKELGMNFRIEFPKEDTELITNGIYRLMRNPIVFGIYLLLLGSFFVLPTIISIFLLIINVITFNSKAKDEEKFLSSRFGEEYENYRQKVGRYLPFSLKKQK
ncbi:MAG: methyltransferase family protein [Promethearchaeota archaeon]